MGVAFACNKRDEVREKQQTLRASGGDCGFDSESLAAGLDCRNGKENGDLCGTLQAKSNGGFSYNCTHPVRVGGTVRRLTPMECARLQGFPDWWCVDIPHSDTAEYKMWGNGMALPCVFYIMQNMVEVLIADGRVPDCEWWKFLSLPKNPLTASNSQGNDDENCQNTISHLYPCSL